MRAALLAAVLVASGCAPAAVVAATASATATPETALPATVVESRYGSFVVRTAPGATCELRIRVDRGEFGDGPPDGLSGTAGADGSLSWTYPAPLVPAGRGEHAVTCAAGERSGDAVSDFDIAARALDPRGFTVRLQAVDPLGGLGGVTSRLEPSLVPARDADVAALRSTLASEWSAATRGLGALALVDANADITVFVLPGRGTSLHVRASDGTRRVLLFVVDEFGTMAPENSVAVALHELGHIWCCSGPGAGSDGHWAEKLPDPLLQGVDRFGLMTHPVTCLVKGALSSCPNRFSERDLRSFGFTAIPAPPPDPCVTRSNELKARLAALEASLAESKAAIATLDARLADLRTQIRAIEAQYPSLVMPPSVYATYKDLIDRYNALLGQERTAVASHNANVAERNDVAARLNALPC